MTIRDRNIGLFFVNTDLGSFEIPGRRIGPLFVHPYPNPDRYRISHIETGLRVVPIDFVTVSHAIRVAEIVAALPGWDDVKPGRDSLLAYQIADLAVFFADPLLTFPGRYSVPS